MRRIVIIASSPAGVICATKIKRRLPESEVNLLLPVGLENIKKLSGAAARRIAKSLPDMDLLAAREIGVLEANSIMTDLEKQEITVSSTRGNLPVRFNDLLAEISASARLPRILQKSNNVFAAPFDGFAADAEPLDNALATSAENNSPVIIIGSGLPALDSCFLAMEAGAKVLMIVPEDCTNAKVEPHLWHYLLKNIQEDVQAMQVDSISSITPLIDQSTNECAGLQLQDGSIVKGHAYIWATQFMARHPILREDGFTLDADGKICADEAANRNVFIFGSGAKLPPAVLTGGTAIQQVGCGLETAISSATALARQISLDLTKEEGFWATHRACTSDMVVCRSGLSMQEAADLGLEAEIAITSESTSNEGILCLAMLMDKKTQTLMGVQLLGLGADRDAADALFNAALGLLADQVPVSKILNREYCGLTGLMLTRCASILENKVRGPIFGISPDEFLASAKAGAEFFTLDLRSNSEWQAGHLPDSYNIPLLQLKKRLQDEVPRFTPLVLVCNTGNDAHNVACKLLGLGANSLYVLDGGMNLWPY